jgi:hypothetical protein
VSGQCNSLADGRSTSNWRGAPADWLAAAGEAGYPQVVAGSTQVVAESSCDTAAVMSARGVTDASGVPYFSQWESPELVPWFIDGSLRPADDPRWAGSGARTPQEYEYWSGKVCGLACLKMIMGWRGLPVPATMHLVERALAWQAYVPDGDHVAGLIYRPFAQWVGDDYGIAAEVVPELPLRLVAGLASPSTPVIASVHKWVRWPDRVPPERGGHLVLVTGAADGLVRLHNPSGMPGASQRDALVEVTDFARFFAERGLIIRG